MLKRLVKNKTTTIKRTYKPENAKPLSLAARDLLALLDEELAKSKDLASYSDISIKALSHRDGNVTYSISADTKFWEPEDAYNLRVEKYNKELARKKRARELQEAKIKKQREEQQLAQIVHLAQGLDPKQIEKALLAAKVGQDVIKKTKSKK